jgi:hypothetical protein
MARPTLKNVNNWYGKLGPLSELEGVKPDMLEVLKGFLAGPEIAGRDDEATITGGNLAHELALLSEGEEADRYFDLATRMYNSVVLRNQKDITNPLVRRAMAHSFDAQFGQLTERRRSGKTQEEEFQADYQHLHEEYVAATQTMATRGNISAGELYEWYGVMVIRHQLWMHGHFGDVEVRRAFTPREDRPHDRMRQGGRHVNPASGLPIYAFDIKVTDVSGNGEPRYIQSKWEDDHGRYAKPPLTVWVYKMGEPLHAHTAMLSEIMLRSYRNEASMEESGYADAAVGQYEMTGV